MLSHGGLDYHIEHHLFPELSYVHYPALQPIVEAYCREHGYPYRRLSWGRAMWRSIESLAENKPVVDNHEDLVAYGAPRLAVASMRPEPLQPAEPTGA